MKNNPLLAVVGGICAVFGIFLIGKACKSQPEKREAGPCDPANLVPPSDLENGNSAESVTTQELQS